ncbi:MAG TPA: sigma-70 family RNA polymerase sigma factor [Candidatus Binatia bacterium]|jgi:RNA polymerase sigma-70 factor (ECF subfamily)|nr:sigma-70 family RNA polymerase sigma factor [Candidatus Binatia bacterium]
MDESTVIKQAKSDKEAFGRLYERYVDKIFNYIYYRTGNERDAEDLTARVFFRAMQHIESYEDRGFPFSAWLYRIAHNLVANWHRDHSRRQVFSIDNLEQWYVTQDGPELAAEKIDDREELLQAIQRLPADRQDLLIFKFVEQLTNAEIGAIMGRSEGAIKSLYYRTLQELRVELTEKPRRQALLRSLWRSRSREKRAG